MFTHNMTFTRQCYVELIRKLAKERRAPHSLYKYVLTIVGHYDTVIIEGLYCCGAPQFEVTES